MVQIQQKWTEHLGGMAFRPQRLNLNWEPARLEEDLALKWD